MDGILYMKLLKATKQAFIELFKEHNESFYYCTLITTKEGNCPYISAWSWEALKVFMDKGQIPKTEIINYKWSYADSPYCAYGWDYFKEVEAYVLEKKPKIINDEEACYKWVNSIIETMEKVMSTLDEQGVFGVGARRKNLLINAEFIPPDHTNTVRALRLNQEEDIQSWLREASEKAAGYLGMS